MKTYEFPAGATPLLISMPHDGTEIPKAIAARMTERALCNNAGLTLEECFVPR